VNQGAFKPASHDDPAFKTFGVGSGGGNHAALAKRDIESCASFHDPQGADPTCIVCHVDSDGIKGNNPKTHPLGFMRVENGNWHSDRGAVCFVCHTDPNSLGQQQRGTGFCGYCHS
jgi:hypothetical protein